MRSSSFRRNNDLEILLQELGELLGPGNSKLLEQHSGEDMPKVFVCGPLRSGTTLFMQWLASLGYFAYPTNLLSRFYSAPLVGVKVQELLTSPRYSFRDELSDLTPVTDFKSENGKTSGALSPNEFWYFWRRFLGPEDVADLSSIARKEAIDLAGLSDELNALANIFSRPLAIKGMIINECIPQVSALFRRALFVRIRRNPVYNIQSVLRARERQLGSRSSWYSFKIRAYPELKGLSAIDSAAGQIYHLEKALDSGFSILREDQCLTVEYEDFCSNPERVYQALREKMAGFRSVPQMPGSYEGVSSFDVDKAWRLDDISPAEVEAAYRRFVTQNREC